MTADELESTGESDLLTLISDMSPILDDQVWVFVSAKTVSNEFVAEHALATFREREGTTLIVLWENAEAFDRCSAPMARITLNIHSSLAAVGLTAAVSKALASEAISANIVAGFYHDHIFIPKASAETAMAALLSLTSAPEAL